MHTFQASQAAELATVVRSGFVESRHLGSAIVLAPNGRVQASLGDPAALIYPRSALKPLQAIASLQAGAELQGAQIAIAAASHRGSFEQMGLVQSILDEAGLDADALACPATWPADRESYHALIRAGKGQQRLAANCSGKHAAFLLACVKNKWSLENYLDPQHPLQKGVYSSIKKLSAETPQACGLDGCGAPLWAISLRGLARAYSKLGKGIRNIAAEARLATLATAMVDYPEYLQGPQQPVTILTELLGATVKNGAEGVLALGLPSGAALALKILDGSWRAAPLIALKLLQACGHISSLQAQQGLEACMRPVTAAQQPVGAIQPGQHLAALLGAKTKKQKA